MKTQSKPRAGQAHMPGHTPSPWSFQRMALGSSPDRRCGFVVNGPEAEPLPVRICDLRCTPEAPFAQTEANARLIAAAPELLEALRHIEDYCHRQAMETTDEAPLWAQCRSFARAAIAKAEGRR